MKAAIFGGSFDPPHSGHIAIIEEALKKLDIDTLFIIPTYLNPFKEKFFSPAKIRYKWVKKLLENYDKVQVLDFEIKKNRSVPTIETVQYLYQTYNIDKLYIIIGADNLPSLYQWKEIDALKKLAEFVVASRKEVPIPQDLKKLDINVNISSTELRNCINKAYLPQVIAEDIIQYYKEKNGSKN